MAAFRFNLCFIDAILAEFPLEVPLLKHNSLDELKERYAEFAPPPVGANIILNLNNIEMYPRLNALNYAITAQDIARLQHTLAHNQTQAIAYNANPAVHGDGELKT